MEHSIIDFMIFSGGIHEEIKFSKEYKNASKKVDKIYDTLRDMLTEEQREQFDKFVNSSIDATALSNEDYFKLGVKVGVRLAAECMFDE